jgi:hypothetical protein
MRAWHGGSVGDNNEVFLDKIRQLKERCAPTL